MNYLNTLNTLNIFSIPLWESEIIDFETKQQHLIEAIQQYRTQNPNTIGRYCAGGAYQSPPAVFQIPVFQPVIQQLFESSQQMMSALGLVGGGIVFTGVWANIHDRIDHRQNLHAHNAVVSGVLYLQASHDSGALVLENPGRNLSWVGLDLVEEKNQFTAQKISIMPRPGQILFWPSFVPHFVEPNRTPDDVRISVSFDIQLVTPEMQQQSTGTVPTEPTQKNAQDQPNNKKFV